MCINQPTLALIRTEDGSSTLYNTAVGEHYHSVHGAVQESRHIFIDLALEHRLLSGTSASLSVLEFGFGTGLNALLSLLYAQEHKLALRYTSLELYPVEAELWRNLDFALEQAEAGQYLQALHTAPWGKWQEIGEGERFALRKLQCDMQTYIPEEGYDLIYFDAFSPEVQPELWSEELFRRLYACANSQAVLTTYCAKGEVRRRLQRAGWLVKRLPGPPGKREVLRAMKAK